MKEGEAIEDMCPRGWIIRVELDGFSWFISGRAGKKDCCDEINPCRHCLVLTEYDPATGHGYSEFDSAVDMTRTDGHRSLEDAIEWAQRRLGGIIPAAEKKHSRTYAADRVG